MNSVVESSKLEKDLNRVRNKKISKLKQKIASGKYRVDNMRLAQALFMAR